MKRNLALAMLVWVLALVYSAAEGRESGNPEAEAGRPYIRNFSPKAYNGGTQNFAITRDKYGLIYIANTAGVLIYDGVSWRLAKMPNQSAARSLCAVNDRIYVGAVGEMGYLSSDHSGQLRYTSLRNEIPGPNRDFEDVYSTVAIGDTIYFGTRNLLVRRAKGTVRVWRSNSPMQHAYVVNQRLYVARRGVGLLQMVEDSLQMLPGGEMLADKAIRTMISFGNSQILIGSFAHGLYLFDGAGIRNLSTAIDPLLQKNGLRNATHLPGGLIALATGGGAVIINRQGQLRQFVNRTTGLRNEFILSLCADHQGGLWLGLNNGIARVETPSPVTRFQARRGVESYVESIIRRRGALYISTGRGVSYLDSKSGLFPAFKPVSGYSTLSWYFLSTGAELLVGTQHGVFRIAGSRATKLNDLPAVILHRSRLDSTKIYAGTLNGLMLLEQAGDKWIDFGMVSDIKERVYSMAEDRDGVLWAGTPSRSVLKIEQDFGGISQVKVAMQVTRFGKEHGIPPGIVSPTVVAGKLFFLTSQGLRHFDAQHSRFLPDSTFGAVFADTLMQFTQLREDARGDVWIVAARGDRKFTGRALRQPDGSYRWEETPFLRMHDLGEVYYVYPEDDGVVWFGGAEGLARYAPQVDKDYRQPYPTLIRRVSNIASDSIVYHGSPLAEQNHPEIAYRSNSLRFQFAAMSYDDAPGNRYQVKLEGFDRSWSNWTTETRKDYASLSPGNYTFRVRARNIYGHLTSEGTFSFKILPPWYREWWAYLFYMALAAGLMALIVKGRVRYLEKKTRELETVVADRTAQVVDQKSKIEEQAQKLEELDRMKSRFFANISHEFRTPLTLILGPLEERIADAKNESEQRELTLIHRNASRVLQLINQLLDLSRLEAGKMKLRAQQQDIVPLTRQLVMGFESLASVRGIDLKFAPPPEPLPVYIDREKYQKIITNLISNALKFTPEGGTVIVEIIPLLIPPLKKGGIGGVEIRVTDTGAGIAADQLPYIFDRFYQVESHSAQPGTGIGLALTKELVELHHGEILVNSEVGKGSVFIVRLPLGRDHLSDDEIGGETDSRESTDAAPVAFPGPMEAEPEGASPETAETEDDNATIILVVEDHTELRSYIRRHLERDYRVVEAHNGREGLQIAGEVIPDLVISDVMMPVMDGYAFCQALKSNQKTSHIPVILLTAKAETEHRIEGLETGADDYLTKPFNSRELLVRLKNLIDLRRRLRERFSGEALIKPAEAAVNSLDAAFLEKVLATIDARLPEEDFHVEALSRELGMGRRQLHRKIRALINQTPTELIRSLRLKRARQLLERNAGTVSEIAFMVGFSNLSYFARCFRQQFGKLPSEFSSTGEES